MASIAICSHGLGLTSAVSDLWDRLEVPQLIAGETALQAGVRRTLIHELGTTSNDLPRLGDLLKRAGQISPAPWLLLIDPEIRLGASAIQNLHQLCRADAPRQLVVGRAWRLPQPVVQDLPREPRALDQIVEDLLCQQGRRDPPELCSWVLLPRACLCRAPEELSCSPIEAVPWLASQARRLGWPVLDASAAVTAVRPESAVQTSLTPSIAQDEVMIWRSCRQATGAVLPRRPGAPRLSLLIAAPPDRLPHLQQKLDHDAPLPWNVVVEAIRPDEGHDPIPAWARELPRATGDLIWPLGSHTPPLPLLASVLRAFERPTVDLVQLSPSFGSTATVAPPQRWPAAGCLVFQADWLRRLGGFSAVSGLGGAAPALGDLLWRAERRGASCLKLPLGMPA
jgi:hypothetical protein